MAETPKIIEWIQAAAPGGRLVSDSRRVRHGDVFFAYPGEAAPTFATLAANALRAANVPPDSTVTDIIIPEHPLEESN
jgi:UDP-N-acetylmuramyl pentapeptide synthase